MRVVLFANGRVGLGVARFLAERDDADVVALVLHDDDSARQRAAIRACLPDAAVVKASRLRDEAPVELLRGFTPELGVSAYFGHILRRPILDVFPRGVVNLHPSYLPWNRGAHTNVWSIVERTPAGVSLHVVDEGVDTGPLIARREVPVHPTDTGRSLYLRLEEAALALFSAAWPSLADGSATATAQPEGGSLHRARELTSRDRIDLDARYTARELIDLLRARTFPPHAGAWFEEDGVRVQVRVELTVVDASADGDDA